MMLRYMNRKSIAEAIRKAYPPLESLWVRFGECTIAVQTNDGEILSGLQTYFHPFLVPEEGHSAYTISVHEAEAVEIGFPLIPKMPDPGKTRIKEEYVDLEDGRIVRKRLTGMLFVFGESDHIAIGPCRNNLNQVINFINNRYIQWMLDAGGILTHAAGVVFRGLGIAIAGFSGMGKSTLSLHLLREGADFVSNDRLVLEKTPDHLLMHGVAKLPRINPGTILNNPNLHGLLSNTDVERYSGMTAETLWRLEEKYDAPIDRCFPKSRFLLCTPLHALLILNWKPRDKPMHMQTVSLNDRKGLLATFQKPTGLFYLGSRGFKPDDPTDVDYLERLGETPIYEITGGVDFKAVIDRCKHLF